MHSVESNTPHIYSFAFTVIILEWRLMLTEGKGGTSTNLAEKKIKQKFFNEN